MAGTKLELKITAWFSNHGNIEDPAPAKAGEIAPRRIDLKSNCSTLISANDRQPREYLMTIEASPEKSGPNPALLQMAAEIISAYVVRNAVPAAELPALIAQIHSSLAKLASGSVAPAVEPPKEPAVAVKKSVTSDYIICLEDGKKFKSLKRHLSTAYKMTPQEYRSKWGLPHDYPMVAPGYSSVRSGLAKQAGLGQKAAESRAAKKKPAKKAA